MTDYEVLHYEPLRSAFQDLSGRLRDGYGPKFLNNPAPKIDYIFGGSLAKGDQAGITAPPGSGKNRLICKMAVHAAAGLPCLNWEMGLETLPRVLIITGEESEAVLHQRVRDALFELPEEARLKAAYGLYAYSLCGCGPISLFTTDTGGRVIPSEGFSGLYKAFDELTPDLAIFDSFSLFCPVNENSNPDVTTCFSYMGQLAQKYGTTVLFIHHTNKVGSVCADSETSLRANLSPVGARGGTAFVASVRWLLMMSPLTATFAGKLFGPEAAEMPDGTFLGAKVAKKNIGRAEDIFYLKHTETGLDQVYPSATGQDFGPSDAELLAAEVKRRESTGEPALSEKSGGEDAFKWGWNRSKKAAERAVREGLLVAEKRAGGRGFCLRTPGGKPQFPRITPEGGVYDFSNENS
jgi:hypothetical protein